MTRHGRALAILAGCLTIAVAAAGAQRRAAGEQAPTGVPVTIALKVGGAPFDFNGTARCTHAPQASFYDVRAERWMVEQSAGAGSVTLALWRPVSGTDMISLSVGTNGKGHRVSTLKAGTRGAVEGSGTISLATQDKGGTFTVNATAADGTKIAGTIRCAAFMPAVAEGGD